MDAQRQTSSIIQDKKLYQTGECRTHSSRREAVSEQSILPHIPMPQQRQSEVDGQFIVSGFFGLVGDKKSDSELPEVFYTVLVMRCRATDDYAADDE